MSLQELQVDTLPGPTHHFGALSFGNIASMNHAGRQSNPRAAALQCLAKMRQVLKLGLVQAVLPPLERPDIGFLRALGFHGADAKILESAARTEPHLLGLAMSSAFMWTANMATVIPGTDARDGACHLMAANLAAMPHRSLEAAARTGMLKRCFAASAHIAVHPPLPCGSLLGDEGAANHSRLAAGDGSAVCHLFVYGRSGKTRPGSLPRKFPARQSYEASRAVARLGRLSGEQALFVQQDRRAIDAGAFHNDVVMVGDGDHILLHEHSWKEQTAVLRELKRRVPGLEVHQVAERDLPLAEAVRSYLFNSQLLSTGTGRVLLAPADSRRGASGRITRRLVDTGFVGRVIFQELDESMAGGGGPACLRLRIPLSRGELGGVAPGILLTETKIARLEEWARCHYRDRLAPEDLGDPQLLKESREAQDRLTAILELGPLYSFQRSHRGPG